MEKENCILNIPYPDISYIKEDPRIAALLYEAYAGRIGELSAVSEYIYQSLMFQNEAPLFSEMIECISITEMDHFKLLGHIILLLGGNPVIKTQIKNNAIKHNAPPIESIEKVLQKNIEAEKAAVAYYNKVALHTHDKTLVAVLKRIIMDEEHHIKLFSDMLENIK